MPSRIYGNLHILIVDKKSKYLGQCFAFNSKFVFNIFLARVIACEKTLCLGKYIVIFLSSKTACKNFDQSSSDTDALSARLLENSL